jgi:hypothetical protein
MNHYSENSRVRKKDKKSGVVIGRSELPVCRECLALESHPSSEELYSESDCPVFFFSGLKSFQIGRAIASSTTDCGTHCM